MKRILDAYIEIMGCSTSLTIKQRDNILSLRVSKHYTCVFHICQAKNAGTSAKVQRTLKSYNKRALKKAVNYIKKEDNVWRH
jgi:hypothetical protein